MFLADVGYSDNIIKTSFSKIDVSHSKCVEVGRGGEHDYLLERNRWRN